MTTKHAKRGGETASRDSTVSTHDTAIHSTLNTPIHSTVLTAPRSTRPYKPRARKCACGCGVVFTPKTKHGRYSSEACRKRAYARRKAKAASSAPKEAPPLEVGVCEWCGAKFWTEADNGQAYCKPSHRTAAWRARRAATVQKIAELDQCTLTAAEGQIKALGLKVIAEYLTGRGYVYSTSAKRWIDKPRGKVIPFELAG